MILPMLASTLSELSFEVPFGALNKNMRRMRVIVNKDVAYDAYLRQTAPTKAGGRWYSTNLFPIIPLTHSTKSFLIK